MAAPIDDALICNWLSARSLARGLPQPVPDHGGFRVDTGAETEIQRWVFAQPGEGLRALALGITQPAYLIKLCGPADYLRPLLPPGWHVQASGYMMAGPGVERELSAKRCPDGYTIELQQNGAVSHVHILAPGGELAASGYSAETPDAFVYDRIATAEGHRRLGLGTLVMHTLQSCKRHSATPELLVATEAGCALYRTLGWQVLSDYSTGHAPVA
jgi:hypothetical protein